MAEQAAETVDGRGRPRRFDEETERRKLLDAAITLMIRHGYAAVTVADVLQASGLSTRSFYRQFESKDELLAALVRREVGSVARRLEQAVAVAVDPVAGVEAWIDGFLDTFFEPGRAERAAVFATSDVLSAPPLADGLVRIRGELSGPLAATLRAGDEAGVLTSPAPELDAACIFGLVTAIVRTPAGRPRSRDAVRAQVLRFVHPALGVTPGG